MKIKMRTKLSRSAFLAIIALLMGAQSLFASELTSPVQVFDAIRWLKVQEQAKANPKIASLKLLVELHYDQIIRRPWEQKAYWEEVNYVWTEFRKSYCPSELELCTLPGKIETLAQMSEMRQKFVAAKERALINAAIQDSEMQLTGNLYFPGLSAEPKSDQDNFSLRISKIAEKKSDDVTSGSRQIWLTDAVMYDIASYQSGFSMKPVPSYFALDAEGNSYLQIEKIKMAAMDLAPNWKRIKVDSKKPDAVHAEELMLQTLRKNLEPQFAEIYPQLLKKMDENNPAHREDIERFGKEREQGDYPLEVYQAVAYRQLFSLVSQQAQLYQKARADKKALDAQATTLEAMLMLQTSAQPLLYGYILHRIAVTEAGPILEQVLTQQDAGMLLLEQLSAVLDVGPYQGRKNFEKFSQTFNYQMLLEPKFLKTQRTKLYKYLSDLQLLKPEQLAAAPLAIQRQVLIDYLMDEQQVSGRPQMKIVPASLYRLSGVMLLNMKAEQLKELAAIVIKERFSK